MTGIRSGLAIDYWSRTGYQGRVCHNGVTNTIEAFSLITLAITLAIRTKGGKRTPGSFPLDCESIGFPGRWIWPPADVLVQLDVDPGRKPAWDPKCSEFDGIFLVSASIRWSCSDCVIPNPKLCLRPLAGNPLSGLCCFLDKIPKEKAAKKRSRLLVPPSLQCKIMHWCCLSIDGHEDLQNIRSANSAAVSSKILM